MNREVLRELKQRCADLHLERQRINARIEAAEAVYHAAKERYEEESR